jgi:hypothetical protein
MSPAARRRALLAIAAALTLLALLTAGPARLRACTTPDEPMAGAPVALPAPRQAVAPTSADHDAADVRRDGPVKPVRPASPAEPDAPASPGARSPRPDRALPPPPSAYGGEAGVVPAWAELTWYGAAPLVGSLPVALPTWEAWLPDVGACSAAVASVPTPEGQQGAWATVTVCLLGTCSTSAARQVEDTVGPRTSVGLAVGRCAVTLRAQP